MFFDKSLLFSIFISTIFVVFAAENRRRRFPTIVGSYIGERLKRESIVDACSKMETIPNAQSVSIKGRYGSVSRPWSSDKHPNAMLYAGGNLQYIWEHAKSTRIRGMDIRLTQLLELYDKNRCLFIAWGRAVRNMVLGEDALPLTGEISCSLYRIYQICKTRFGTAYCHYLKNRDFVLVGRLNANKSEHMLEPLRLFTWGALSSGAPDQHDYTANMLGIYDTYGGNNYLIDPSGRAFRDVCQRKILPTISAIQKWPVWSQNNLKRLLNFFEMTIFHLIGNSQDFEHFIYAEIRQHFTKQEFQEFLCESIYEGFSIGDGTSNCVTSHERVAELRERRLVNLRDAFYEAFYENDKIAGGFYGVILNSMASMTFVDTLPVAVVANDNSPTISIASADDDPRHKFIYSHQPLTLPTTIPTGSSRTTRLIFDDGPSRQPKIERVPVPLYPTEFYETSVRRHDSSLDDFSKVHFPLSTEVISLEAEDLSDSSSESEETKTELTARIRARLGAHNAVAVWHKPFGIAIFDAPTPFVYSLRTHVPFENSSPLSLRHLN